MIYKVDWELFFFLIPDTPFFFMWVAPVYTDLFHACKFIHGYILTQIRPCLNNVQENSNI